MKCSITGCPGEYQERQILQTERHGGKIIVINDVPADVCDFCGDVLLSIDTVRRIEDIVREAGTPDRVAPVYDYASST